MAQMRRNPPAMQETLVQSLGQKDPLEEDMTSLQCPCLENPMAGGAWWDTVHRVAQSQIQLQRPAQHSRALIFELP